MWKIVAVETICFGNKPKFHNCQFDLRSPQNCLCHMKCAEDLPTANRSFRCVFSFRSFFSRCFYGCVRVQSCGKCCYLCDAFQLTSSNVYFSFLRFSASGERPFFIHLHQHSTYKILFCFLWFSEWKNDKRKTLEWKCRNRHDDRCDALVLSTNSCHLQVFSCWHSIKIIHL